MTASGGGAGMACHDPIDVAILVDYWLGQPTFEDEDAVEEHLFTCDRCGDRLREVIALNDSLRDLARSGALQVIVSEEFVQRITEAGRRVRQYAPPPGGVVQCTVNADDDFLLARLAADLTGAGRVDLSWCDERGVEIQRMTDIPARADAGLVVCQQSITFAKASPTTTMVARLLSVDDEGAERILGEYAFHHTRTISGPPG